MIFSIYVIAVNSNFQRGTLKLIELNSSAYLCVSFVLCICVMYNFND